VGSFLGVEVAAVVAREMIARYKIQREQTRRELEEKYKKPVYFAHELVGCKLKRELARAFTEIDLANSYVPRMMLGEVVEHGLTTFMSKLGFVKPDSPCVEEFLEIVVAGSPDYISVDRKILVDVKYSRSPITREHHVARMKIYLTICKAELGVLLYISSKGIKSYGVVEKLDPQDIVKLAKSNSSPRYQWECKLCAYSDFCPVFRGERSG
jgi:CRISPR/Cas system-associated exonuclease Cas4 (RecB family)